MVIMLWLCWCLYMYTCMYVCHCLTEWGLVYANYYIRMYVCIYVTVWQGHQELSLLRNDCLRRWMAWGGSWSYEESIEKSIHDKYTRLVSYGYELILCDYIMPMFMLCQVMWKDTSTKWKQCGLRYAGTSIDKILGVRFLGRDNVILDVK